MHLDDEFEEPVRLERKKNKRSKMAFDAEEALGNEELDEAMLQNMTMEEIDKLASKLKPQAGMTLSERPFDAMSMAESAHTKMAARRSEKAASRPTKPLIRAAATSGRKKKQQADEDQDLKQAVANLLEDMQHALDDDRKSNTNKKPAIKRFQLLERLDALLRRESARDSFFNQHGFMVFYDWLCEMPDGTYPNSRIVLTVLQQIDRFEVSKQDMENVVGVEDVLTNLASGIAGSGYADSAGLAKRILDKWARVKHNIKTTYDDQGKFDRGWESLHRKLHAERSKAGPPAKRQRIDPDTEDLPPIDNYRQRLDNLSRRNKEVLEEREPEDKKQVSMMSSIRKKMLKMKRGKGGKKSSFDVML